MPPARVPKRRVLSLGLESFQMLIDINELAALLQRSPETIRKDLTRNPAAVPPRTKLPGTRLLRWHAAAVDSWLRSFVDEVAK